MRMPAIAVILLADVSVFNLANLLSIVILVFVIRFMICPGKKK